MVINYFELSIIIILGLLVGSFISMASYRLPLGQELVFTRSHCTKCNHSLSAANLIPIISWLINGGRCYYCKANISKRYPSIELATALSFVTVYLKFGINLNSAILILVAATLLIMIVTDFEHYIIPDSIQITLLVLAIVRALINNLDLKDLILAAVISSTGIFILGYLVSIYKKMDSLGFGDVKFMVVSGMFLGTKPLAVYLFMAGLLGVICGLIWKKITKLEIFPFGPSLAVSMFICLIIPNISEIVNNSIFKLAHSITN